MVDITDYIVENELEHNFKVVIDEEVLYVFVPDEERGKVYECCRDGEFSLYEKIEEGMKVVPYVQSSCENMELFHYVMKKLYNHTGTVAHIEDNIELLCCPEMRVNSEMLAEIHSTFKSICKEKKVECEVKILDYMPLSAPVSCYRDQVPISTDMGIAGCIASALSSNAEISTIGKRKVLVSKDKRDAVCDSILLSKVSKISDITRAKELLPLISIDRSRDMHHFTSIGRCLYNIFKSDSEGLELWKTITVPQRQDFCDECWPDIGTTSTLYTIRYLQYCASVDSPDRYKKWNASSIRGAIEESVLATGGILDVATAGYRIDPTLYVCEGDNYTEAAIYKFNGTYYALTGEYDMRNYLDKKLIKEYKSFLRELVKNIDDTPENSVKIMLQSKMDNTIKIITKLKDPAYQLNVVKVMSRLYNIPGFCYMKNSNPNLLVFEDCVWDCDKKEMRAGIPEDYTTVSCHYKFLEEWNTYNYDNPLVQLVLENMEKIIYNKDKREFFYDQMTRRLKGSNPEKRGMTMFGYNNNAKSGLCTWLGKVFGRDYFPNVPSNILYSEDTHPGVATPHWQMVANARIIAMTEVSDKNILNEGNYKKITGSTDPITYRGLYSKRIESFIPCCVPITVCNSLPKMNGNSAALQNRILLLKLDSRFITKDNLEWEELKNKTEEEQIEYMKENHWYWADPGFDSLMQKTYKAFMWILIQRYIKGQYSPIPSCVIEDTFDYFRKSNMYLQFVKQCIKKEQAAQGVSTYTLFSIYKKWYSDNIARFGHADFPKFLEEMESIRVTAVNDFYKGISIIYK